MAAALAELINKYRHNRKMLLFIVYIALFLDNMLLTTVGMFLSFQVTIEHLINYRKFKY